MHKLISFTGGYSCLASFLHDRKGGVAPMLALATIPLLGFSGAAVDYSRAASMRSSMQAALDATTLMLAKNAATMSSDQISQLRSSYFAANMPNTSINNVSVRAELATVSGGYSVAGSVSGSVATQFMRIIGFDKIPIVARSTALATSDGLGCVLSLNPTASGAVTSQGSTNVALNNCSLYDNSNNATALTAGGSSSLSALAVGVVGGISSIDNIVTTDGIFKISPVPDPYADANYPSKPASCQNQSPIHTTQTLAAGFYCGLTLNSNANVSLSPGVYYIGQGGLSVDGQATLTGTGVTLVFTSSGGKFGSATINGGATVDLTPPTYGPTSAIVVFGDRDIPLGTTFKFNGGASQNLAGAIYVPTGAIQFSGGMGTSTSCTQIIGNTITFTGNSNVAINCSRYKTKPFSPTVVRLVS